MCTKGLAIVELQSNNNNSNKKSGLKPKWNLQAICGKRTVKWQKHTFPRQGKLQEPLKFLLICLWITHLGIYRFCLTTFIFYFNCIIHFWNKTHYLDRCHICFNISDFWFSVFSAGSSTAVIQKKKIQRQQNILCNFFLVKTNWCGKIWLGWIIFPKEGDGRGELIRCIYKSK